MPKQGFSGCRFFRYQSRFHAGLFSDFSDGFYLVKFRNIFFAISLSEIVVFEIIHKTYFHIQRFLDQFYSLKLRSGFSVISTRCDDIYAVSCFHRIISDSLPRSDFTPTSSKSTDLNQKSDRIQGEITKHAVRRQRNDGRISNPGMDDSICLMVITIRFMKSIFFMQIGIIGTGI